MKTARRGRDWPPWFYCADAAGYAYVGDPDHVQTHCRPIVNRLPRRSEGSPWRTR
jgi:hypothetical protein